MLMIMQGFNQHSDPFWKNESKVQITRIRKKLSAGFCDCSVNFFFQIPFCFAYLNTVACRGPVMPEATAWYSGTAEQQ